MQPKIFRGVEEDEEEFNKRVRKTNYLSLAQEFAELKKVNANALPFGLHKDEYQSASPLSEGESGSDLDSADQCNDNSSGFKLSNGDCSVIDSGQARDEGLTTEKTEVKSGSGEAVNLTDEKKQEDAEIDEKELHDPDCDLASSSNLQRGLLTCEALSKKVEMKSKESGDNPHSKKNQAVTSASDADSLMAAGHESDSSSFTDSPVRVKVTRRKMDESLGESLGEFDIYTVETALPQMDWQHLEEQLQKAAEEEQQKWVKIIVEISLRMMFYLASGPSGLSGDLYWLLHDNGYYCQQNTFLLDLTILCVCCSTICAFWHFPSFN